jgi:hypothetical protein
MIVFLLDWVHSPFARIAAFQLFNADLRVLSTNLQGWRPSHSLLQRLLSTLPGCLAERPLHRLRTLKAS